MNKYLLVFVASIVLFSNQLSASEQYPVKGEFSLGLLLNEGNSESKSYKSGFKIGQDREKWRLGLDFKSLAESSEGANTAERYRLETKVDYKFTEFNYAFLYASYDDDRFTDYDYQASVALGYGRRILKSEAYNWDVEIGPGYRMSNLNLPEENCNDADAVDCDKNEDLICENDEDCDEDENEAIWRLATNFDWKISETASFLQKINVESGSDNTFSQSETALKVMINSKLSLKLAYLVKYVEELPEDSEKDHADRETSVSVLYSF